jgi:hypothetical protein
MWQVLTIILGSGVVSALATHILTTGVAEKNFRRQKLEELYLVARKYCRSLTDDAIRYGMQTPKAPHEFVDFKEWRKEYDQVSETLHMLTDLCFPELSPRLTTFQANFESFVKEKGTSEKELKESGARFAASIVVTAQRMNRPWYLRLKDRLRL